MKKIAEVLLIIFVFSVGIVFAQKVNLPSQVWWIPDFFGKNKSEKGKFDELKGKKRVYVSMFLGNMMSPDRETFQQRVNKDLAKNNDFEIVNSPDDADFAIHFGTTYFSNASNSIIEPVQRRPINPTIRLESECQFYILTRGSQISDGIFTPRVLFSRISFENDCRDSASRSVANFGKKLAKLK